MQNPGLTRKSPASDAANGLKPARRFSFVPFVVLIGALAANVLPSTMTLTTVYPAPSGVYRALITTGGKASNPYNTILTRDAGNVGIGTMNPIAKLQIDGAGGYVNTTINSAAGQERDLMWASGGSPRWIFRAEQNAETGSDAGSDLILMNRADNGTFKSDVMYFQRNSGNVGIGTGATPGAKLEVAGQVKISDGSQGAGKVLTSDANGLASWAPAPGGSSSQSIQVFTSNGTFTVPSGVTKLWVEVYGGGGAGGAGPGVSAGGGGGAGGVAMGYVAVSPGQPIAVGVGAGGVAQYNGGGGNGGTSSFAGLSATGGDGGFALSSNYNLGGRGGQGSGGSINLKGGPGNYGMTFCTNNCASPSPVGGIGGTNAKGGGGGNWMYADGGSFGGGGSGCNPCSYGGTGGTGGVIVMY